MKKAITPPLGGQRADAVLAELNKRPDIAALWKSFACSDDDEENSPVSMIDAATVSELAGALRLAAAADTPAVITICFEGLVVSDVMAAFIAWASHRKAGLSLVVPATSYGALYELAGHLADIGAVLGVFRRNECHHAISAAVREWELATAKKH